MQTETPMGTEDYTHDSFSTLCDGTQQPIKITRRMIEQLKKKVTCKECEINILVN